MEDKLPELEINSISSRMCRHLPRRSGALSILLRGAKRNSKVDLFPSPRLASPFTLNTRRPALDLKEIKLLIDMMRKNDLSVFKMENEGFKITLKKNTGFQPVVTQAAAPVPAVAAPTAAASVPDAAPKEQGSSKEIVSPMVGTFYSAASPESPPLVIVGQEVTEDTVVCIIEAMKVMNEIKSEVRGIVAEVVAENGKPVQFGQALFKVK
jgi:acetyl-CoA carboxylase biotin carboxyl carrier protein